MTSRELKTVLLALKYWKDGRFWIETDKEPTLDNNQIEDLIARLELAGGLRQEPPSIGLIERGMSSEYYAGCRDTLWQYAWYKDGVQYVGCGNLAFGQALEQINKCDDESPDGLFKRLEGMNKPQGENQ